MPTVECLSASECEPGTATDIKVRKESLLAHGWSFTSSRARCLSPNGQDEKCLKPQPNTEQSVDTSLAWECVATYTTCPKCNDDL